MNSKSKIAIIGAGYVGASIAFTIVTQRLVNEIALIDIVKEKAAGEAEDIRHGLCYWGGINLYAGDFSDIAGSDIIIVTAGSGRKPGESRLDLTNRNIAIAKSVVDQMMPYYTGGIIMVVSNPVDILTYMITRWTGLPRGKVFGTGTTLDSARFRSMLADLIDVSIENVHGYIIGEHGDSQVIAWSNTHIAGIQVDLYCKSQNISLDDDVKQDLKNKIQTAGAEVIKRKGATYYGIASCVCSLVNSIMKNRNSIFTVSTCVYGQLGINDLALSLPSVISLDGITSILEPTLTPDEFDGLMRSADVCRDVIKSL